MSTEPIPFEELLPAGDPKACCAALYETPPVAWLLDGQLHPGGVRLTRRIAEFARIEPGDAVLDVASGRGDTALLLARELGAEVVGVELGAAGVAAGLEEANRAGLTDSVAFVQGDAESLPFEAARFDAVICECSLCLFPDKRTAVHEMARVLTPGGRVAVADVTVERDALSPPLLGAAARLACVADALPVAGYVRLLEAAGLHLAAVESHDGELAAMIDRVEARLRLARMLRIPALAPFQDQLEEAIELARLAQRAAAAGHLGYSVIVAGRHPD